MSTPALPRPGDVFLVNDQASVQFAGARQITFRVTFVDKKPTYVGWVWLHGYSLDATTGEAVEKRKIFVQVAGLIRPTPPRRPARKSTRPARK